MVRVGEARAEDVAHELGVVLEQRGGDRVCHGYAELA